MLKVAVSSRVLFELMDGHSIFLKEGVAAFDAYMREKEETPLRKGVGFNLVQKLLALNEIVGQEVVKVVLLSSNTLSAGVRVMKSVQHYGLPIDTAMFTSGADRFKLAAELGIDMFLTTNPTEVVRSLDLGVAAAIVNDIAKNSEETSALCLAFDGDAVLFGFMSEEVYQTQGLDMFYSHEERLKNTPLPAGPFAKVLQKLSEIQQFFTNTPSHLKPLRLALVTARGIKVHERVVLTLKEWDIVLDEVYFCGGLSKGPFLSGLGADLFLDDSPIHIESAKAYVPVGQVPNGFHGKEVRDKVALTMKEANK